MRKLLVLLLVAVMTAGCAFPTYHFDSDEEWVDRKNTAFRNAPTPWANLQGATYLAWPYIVIEYFGKDLENIQRYDYFHGYIYARRKPETIPWYKYWIPLGIFSMESYGVIGSNKEWLSRPTMPTFMLQLGLTVITQGVGLIVPTRVWEEEAFHASQEILHQDFTRRSHKFMSIITLQGVPYVENILGGLFYYFHPMEIDAKIKKWVYFGGVFNLDCDEAWNRYCALIIYTASRRCDAEGIKYGKYEPYIALTYLNTPDGPPYKNAVYDMAQKYKGIVVRLPYEQKMVYAPWVHGVMREKKELPWFTRTFLFWVEGHE